MSKQIRVEDSTHDALKKVAVFTNVEMGELADSIIMPVLRQKMLDNNIPFQDEGDLKEKAPSE